MTIDFGKLFSTNSSDIILSPREIFSVLSRKEQLYQYLRDVQAEVLSQWFDGRMEKDIVIKMNTGSGKTVVGLLILKSCLNEDIGPAVYICPDKYLVRQVIGVAEDLSVEVTDDPTARRFLQGHAILVTNIYKLINGKSVFGIGSEGPKIKIGSIVIDDVHACMSSTEEQFTLTMKSDTESYKELFSLFREDLYEQSNSSALDIEDGYPGKNMLVPYWAWINKSSKVAQIIHKVKLDDDLMFKWPLIEDDLQLCRCVFGEGEVELSLRCLPINVVPSFANAKRRIFMSATLSDDSILVSDFDVEPQALTRTITPRSASDIGDRMILAPQELNPNFTGEQLQDFFKALSAKYNVVVIVPSKKRAEFWSDIADQTLVSENLYEGIEALKVGHVGLTILVNRYDGIDLPYDACRILVIDGLPDIRSKIDRIEQTVLSGSTEISNELIQRIEQGMGRGIRANDDQCIVFLIGPSLTRHLYVQGAFSKLSPATRVQMELSERLSEQIGGKELEDLEKIMMYSLNHDSNWVKGSKGALVHVRYSPAGNVNPIVLKQRQAFDSAQIRDYRKAANIIQDAINMTDDKHIQGWLKQQLAEYTHFIDPVNSQVILKSAVTDNRMVLHPLDGIEYIKLNASHTNQAKQCAEYLTEHYGNANILLVEAHGLLDQLNFQPDTASVFESAIAELARLLGLDSQRPEAEYKGGPDVLWVGGQLHYYVIECKNGATTEAIGKRDCNQLSGSMNWFLEKYDTTCSAIPVIVHPVHIVERDAYPPNGMRVLNARKLIELKQAVQDFVQAVSTPINFGDPQALTKLLINYGLMGNLLLERYTVPFRQK